MITPVKRILCWVSVLCVRGAAGHHLNLLVGIDVRLQVVERCCCDAANAARAPPFATMLFVSTGGDVGTGVDD